MQYAEHTQVHVAPNDELDRTGAASVIELVREAERSGMSFRSFTVSSRPWPAHPERYTEIRITGRTHAFA
ncbi:MAG TPA: hypothetical protein P5193_00965 [Microthrixaceae bacterium]|nr:hypothetical protein [Microthrixaceae bacterium]